MSIQHIIKSEVVNRIIEDISAMIERSRQTFEAAEAESRFHKGAMESRYDTFKEEAQYLASAQKNQMNRLLLLKNEISSHQFQMACKSKSDIVKLGSFVEISFDDATQQVYFVVPNSGGIDIFIDDISIKTLNRQSPIGIAIIGSSLWDKVFYTVSNRRMGLRIVHIA